MKDNKERKTTYERLMQNPKWKKEFEKGYERFLKTESLIEKMKENKMK